MTDFITQLLAKWLDKFKTSNPRIFLYIQLTLFAVEVIILKGIEITAIIPGQITDAILLVIPIIMGVLGTRTVKHLPENTKAQLMAREDQYRAYNPIREVRSMSTNPDYLD